MSRVMMKGDLMSGQEVFGPSPDYESLGIVYFLMRDEEGKQIAQEVNRLFKGNRNMIAGFSSSEDNNIPIEMGHLLFGGAVNTALDVLGIKDVKTADPEQVMGVLRLEEPENTGLGTLEGVCYDFGFVIIDRFVGETDWYGLTQELRKNIQLYTDYLMERAGIPEKDLPVVLFNLKSYPDQRFPYNVRLDFVRGESYFMRADALKEKEKFKTTKNQTFEELLMNGRGKDGDLQVEVCGNGALCVDFMNDISFSYNLASQSKFSQILLSKEQPSISRPILL